MTKREKILSLCCRVFVFLNLLPAIFVKFLGATESILIFEQLRVEPAGRYFTGMLELATLTMLIVPRTIWAGGTLGLFIMFGAMLAHVFVLGFHGQPGVAFVSALLTFICCGLIVFFYRKENLFLIWATNLAVGHKKPQRAQEKK